MATIKDPGAPEREDRRLQTEPVRPQDHQSDEERGRASEEEAERLVREARRHAREGADRPIIGKH